MLIRTFRLTDKLANALLRLAAWCAAALLDAVYQFRRSLTVLLAGVLVTLFSVFRRGQGVAVTVGKTTDERRRAVMANRAEQQTRTIIREDPLRTQNRALSLFTVLLLVSLILLVLWFTSNPGIGGLHVAGGVLPTPLPSATSRGALPPPPTVKPSDTPIPDPLRVGGSIAFAQHERGYNNLWAIEIGAANPVRLTNGAFDDRDPVWSHDGKRLAFASHRDGNWELYVMEIATLRVTRLTFTPGYERHPTWSPDDAYIAYEAYDSGNLDIWIVGSGGKSEPVRLTENPAPDFNPAWSSGAGREIAFVSLRDGNPEIYISNLDRPGNPRDSTATRFTNTPDIEEDAPAWGPDGLAMTYTGRDAKGLQFVYLRKIAGGDPTVLGQGRDPAWSPNSSSVIVALDAGGSGTTLLAYPVNAVGIAATTISTKTRAAGMNWSKMGLPATLKANPPSTDPLAPVPYTEEIGYKSDAPPTRRLRDMSNGAGGVHSLYLTDSVDDSFAALREATKVRAGVDFLGSNVDMLWQISGTDRHIPDPGQSLQNWHYAGRSFDFDRNLVYSSSAEVPPPIEIVREDEANGNTYWRIYVRVPDALQNGTLGEPLRRLPWDFASRSSTDPQVVENGGRVKSTVPGGYYLDFTALAEEYGWMRVPAQRNWRGFAAGILYWQFERRDGLTWNGAMLELRNQSEIDAFLAGPPLRPTLVFTSTPASASKTPTPIPPDKQQ